MSGSEFSNFVQDTTSEKQLSEVGEKLAVILERHLETMVRSFEQTQSAIQELIHSGQTSDLLSFRPNSEDLPRLIAERELHQRALEGHFSAVIDALVRTTDSFTKRFAEQQQTLIASVIERNNVETRLLTELLQESRREAIEKLKVRTSHLAKVEDGWLEGKGTAPDGSLVQWFLSEMSRRYPLSLPIPQVYPTPEGGICVEWLLGDWDCSLDVSSAKVGEWHCLNLQTQADEEQELDLTKAENWNWLIDKLKELKAGAT